MQQKLVHMPAIAETARTQPVVSAPTIFAEAPPSAWRPSAFAATPLLTLGEVLEFPALASALSWSRAGASERVRERLLWHCHDLAHHAHLAGRGACAGRGSGSACEAAALARAEACAELETVLVVRFHEFLAPALAGAKYDGGYAKGDLLLFDLDAGRLVCGAPFEAESASVTLAGRELDDSFRTEIHHRLAEAHEACRKQANP